MLDGFVWRFHLLPNGPLFDQDGNKRLVVILLNIRTARYDLSFFILREV